MLQWTNKNRKTETDTQKQVVKQKDGPTETTHMRTIEQMGTWAGKMTDGRAGGQTDRQRVVRTVG